MKISFWKFYNKLRCRLNIYPKHPKGYCWWCGCEHGMHLKMEKPNYGGLNKYTKPKARRSEYGMTIKQLRHELDKADYNLTSYEVDKIVVLFRRFMREARRKEGSK